MWKNGTVPWPWYIPILFTTLRVRKWLWSRVSCATPTDLMRTLSHARPGGLIWISCHKGVSSKSLFCSSVLKRTERWSTKFSFPHKICKLWIKTKAAILHFDDVTTVNCALCDLIAHLTFQMRKVSVQEIQVRPPDVLRRRVWMAGHETNMHPLSRSWTRPQAMRARQKCLSL